ncbi:superoxide dismutase [Clostridium sp. UBA7503]|uniref:superoxide dismutase n=1 Tax=Clostridium sp. UBA7503 TaxID=1946377 RepID=UPI0032169049
MTYDKIKLPYEYNGLEPHIDALTVETHYGKHLQTYVNNLNKLLEGHEALTEGKTLEQLLENLDSIPNEIRQGVINQGGGVANHNFYFSILTPGGKGEPKGELLEKINKAFGSVANMKEAVSKAAIGQFGSGYGWLVLNGDGELEVMATLNQESPLSKGKKPLVTIDVWEHAYYLKYKNVRPDYVNSIWNLFNWDKIQEVYESYK